MRFLICLALSGCFATPGPIWIAQGTAVDECVRLKVPEQRSNMEAAAMLNGAPMPPECGPRR